MKKVILVFSLFVLVSFSSFGQETPIKLIQDTRILVKDSAESVKNPKALVKEAKELLQSLKELEKADKKSKREGKSYKFQLGLTYQPFNFKNYGDEDKLGGARLVKPKGFNGFAVGLMLRKPFTKHFSLKSELMYSQQNEKYLFSTISYGRLGEELTYVYNGEGSVEYNLFKIPILADYALNLDSKNTWFLHAYAGGQVLNLTNYTAIRKTYEVTAEHDIRKDQIEDQIIDQSGEQEWKTWTYPFDEAVLVRTRKRSRDPVFKTISLGVVAGFELEKVFADKFVLGIGAKYEHNLSQSEEKDSGVFSRKDTSQQKRLVLSISISRLIR